MDTKTTTYVALLSPGEHQSDFSSLYQMAVAGYPADCRRHILWKGLMDLYKLFIVSGFQGLDIWIDGSFMTSKPDPIDINAVVWVPMTHMENCTPEQIEQVAYLSDDNKIFLQYKVNLCVQLIQDDADRDWRQWFTMANGQCDSKGFVRIAL